MSGAKEIRTKIASVKNTQKITKAMETVAASKLRPDYRHPFLMEREIKRVGYIIISTDRGLCGGLNVNLFRKLLSELRDWKAKGVEVDLCLIGAKSVQFFRNLNVNVVGATTHLDENPRLGDLLGAIRIMLDAYSEGTVDRVFLLHNEYVNTMTQSPRDVTLLPVEPVDQAELADHWDYLYEPDAIDLLDGVLMRYIESQVYRGAVENVACEMAAKMVAMKAATDNAGTMIEDLQLDYNKARQAAITQELSEIVSGAAAV
jgi:F-type H+-transporting ATPase subunit gamma